MGGSHAQLSDLRPYLRKSLRDGTVLRSTACLERVQLVADQLLLLSVWVVK